MRRFIPMLMLGSLLVAAVASQAWALGFAPLTISQPLSADQTEPILLMMLGMGFTTFGIWRMPRQQ